MKLKILENLFKDCDRYDISYCHWKSNDHVIEGMQGVTDLDILVERQQNLKFYELLAKNGFKRDCRFYCSRYPAISGYLGYDSQSGRFAFVHLHFHLILGVSNVREYRLDWEKVVLERSIRDPVSGIQVNDPHIELVLLYLRAAFKTRSYFLIPQLRKPYFSEKWTRQSDFLLKRVNYKMVLQFVNDNLNKEISILIESMMNGSTSNKNLQILRKLTVSQLPSTETYGAISTLWLKLTKSFSSRLYKFNGEYFGLKLPVMRKTLGSGGVLIAVIGPDGSGKSSLSKRLVESLRWKIDVEHVYFGAGDGSISSLRFIIKKFRHLVSHILTKFSPNRRMRDLSEKNLDIPKSKSLIRRVIQFAYDVPYFLSLSLEKRMKLKRAWIARNRGIVVICDRYPQSQIEGFNDGPMLGKFKSCRIAFLRALSVWEGKPYKQASKVPPDLVIKLNVSPRVAILRDKSLGEDFVLRRIAAVNGLSFPSKTTLIEIDADRDFESVYRDAMDAIWNEI